MKLSKAWKHFKESTVGIAFMLSIISLVVSIISIFNGYLVTSTVSCLFCIVSAYFSFSISGSLVKEEKEKNKEETTTIFKFER